MVGPGFEPVLTAALSGSGSSVESSQGWLTVPAFRLVYVRPTSIKGSAMGWQLFPGNTRTVQSARGVTSYGKVNECVHVVRSCARCVCLLCCNDCCDRHYGYVTIIFCESYEPHSQTNDCSFVRWNGQRCLMNKMVLEAWTECGQVRTGKEILEIKIL